MKTRISVHHYVRTAICIGDVSFLVAWRREKDKRDVIVGDELLR